MAATFILPFLAVPAFIHASIVVLLGSFFALVHGLLRYGGRGMIVFIGVCLFISNILENVSIQTGFPFGFYHYTNLLGPKLFAVPVLIGPAYFATGYLSWVIGNILLDKTDGTLNKLTVFTLPIIAAFIMVMWDLVMDPSSSTLSGLWVWHNGGGFFGVPLTNYLGWFLTVYLFYQAFALYLLKVHTFKQDNFSKSYWYRAILLYLSIGLSYFITYFLNQGGGIVNSAHQSWSAHAIRESAVTISLYTMCFVSLLALTKLLVTQNHSNSK